jgi:hypothetical protein
MIAMEFTKENLQGKTQEELINIVIKLQSDLKVANAWWDYEEKEKSKFFQLYHGIVLPEE